MNKAILIVLCGSTALIHAGSSVAFQTDFDSGLPAEFSGASSLVGVEGYSAYGFANSLLRNDSTGNPQAPTVLTLTGLESHTSVSLSFLLAIMDSWDGTSFWGPDTYTVKLDGSTIFSQVFDNYLGGSGQTYSIGSLFPRANVFGIYHPDAAYDLGQDASLQNIPHTGSTLTLSFYAGGPGWQGGADEAWGIDNLEITLNGVPDGGATGLLALLGWAAAISARRCARR